MDKEKFVNIHNNIISESFKFQQIRRGYIQYDHTFLWDYEVKPSVEQLKHNLWDTSTDANTDINWCFSRKPSIFSVRKFLNIRQTCGSTFYHQHCRVSFRQAEHKHRCQQDTEDELREHIADKVELARTQQAAFWEHIDTRAALATTQQAQDYFDIAQFNELNLNFPSSSNHG